MSDELFERYRDALLLGHRAARRGDVATAVEAYEEAAACAPGRALPWASRGALLLEHGRAGEAAEAYREALRRDPTDAESIAALRRAEAIVAGRPLPMADERAPAPADEPTTADEPAPAPIVRPATPAPMPSAPLSSASAPDEAVELMLDAAEAVAAGDRTRSVELTLAAARAHLARGRTDAAIEVCLRALAAAPDEAELHLFLAERWIERGWRELAAEKLELLRRLATLEDDPALSARVAELVGRAAAGDGPGPGPGRPGR